jgi:hypothetical protein
MEKVRDCYLQAGPAKLCGGPRVVKCLSVCLSSVKNTWVLKKIRVLHLFSTQPPISMAGFYKSGPNLRGCLCLRPRGRSKASQHHNRCSVAEGNGRCGVLAGWAAKIPGSGQSAGRTRRPWWCGAQMMHSAARRAEQFRSGDGRDSNN